MHRWLQSRLPGPLAEPPPIEEDPTEPQVRPAEELPTDPKRTPRPAIHEDESPTEPGPSAPRHAGEPPTQPTEPGARPPPRPEVTDPTDPLRPLTAPDEDVEDASTVRITRMPVAFIGESVLDPTTAYDTGASATEWRKRAGIDEVALLERDPSPPPVDARPPAVGQRAPSPRVAPASAPPVTAPPRRRRSRAVEWVVTVAIGILLGLGALLLATRLVG